MHREQVRVVIVEDHAESAECLRAFLASVGYKVYVAPDLASARALMKAVEFDILVSDIRLPDGTGWQLMKEVNAQHPVPAIAISGYNSKEDVQRSREVGFLNHIAKPLVFDELTNAIEHAVK